MKKKLLLFSLLLFCSCSNNSNNNNSITGTADAKVKSINCKLSSKERDIEFHVQDIIEPTSTNMYSLNLNKHYTIFLQFEIGDGSLPPLIPVDYLHIDYNKNALNIERIKTDYDDDKYLNYITFYDLFIFDQIESTSIVFSINEISSSLILSSY